MNYTSKAVTEQNTYKLNHDAEYVQHCSAYTQQYQRRLTKYNYSKLTLSRADTNMIKALRLSPWLNTSEEWARLHVTEAMAK